MSLHANMKETDDTRMDTGAQLRTILAAIQSVSRFATRGCSGMSCDRVRAAWLGNQLAVIARYASVLPEELKAEHPDIPWNELATLNDSSPGTPGGLTADEMQRFVERQLPVIDRQLKAALASQTTGSGPSRR